MRPRTILAWHFVPFDNPPRLNDHGDDSDPEALLVAPGYVYLATNSPAT